MVRRLFVLSGVRGLVNLLARTILTALFVNVVGWFLQRSIEDQTTPKPAIEHNDADVIDAVIVEEG